MRITQTVPTTCASQRGKGSQCGPDGNLWRPRGGEPLEVAGDPDDPKSGGAEAGFV
jgi:hypothetical protein